MNDEFSSRLLHDILRSIGVFVLATTKFDQSGTSYVTSRIVPLMRTWGGFFPSIYMVFGTNDVDWRFVKSSACRQLVFGESISRRRLVARSPQTPSRNAREIYECSENDTLFRVLRIANCTGEYFGIGPVCRC